MTKSFGSTLTSHDMLTVKDFYRLVTDGQKADLIDGEIYMASPESTESTGIGMFLGSILKMYVDI